VTDNAKVTVGLGGHTRPVAASWKLGSARVLKTRCTRTTGRRQANSITTICDQQYYIPEFAWLDPSRGMDSLKLV
jgi:hypothetical protein